MRPRVALQIPRSACVITRRLLVAEGVEGRVLHFTSLAQTLFASIVDGLSVQKHLMTV